MSSLINMSNINICGVKNKLYIKAGSVENIQLIKESLQKSFGKKTNIYGVLPHEVVKSCCKNLFHCLGFVCNKILSICSKNKEFNNKYFNSPEKILKSLIETLENINNDVKKLESPKQKTIFVSETLKPIINLLENQKLNIGIILQEQFDISNATVATIEKLKEIQAKILKFSILLCKIMVLQEKSSYDIEKREDIINTLSVLLGVISSKDKNISSIFVSKPLLPGAKFILLDLEFKNKTDPADEINLKDSKNEDKQYVINFIKSLNKNQFIPILIIKSKSTTKIKIANKQYILDLLKANIQPHLIFDLEENKGKSHLPFPYYSKGGKILYEPITLEDSKTYCGTQGVDFLSYLTKLKPMQEYQLHFTEGDSTDFSEYNKSLKLQEHFLLKNSKTPLENPNYKTLNDQQQKLYIEDPTVNINKAKSEEKYNLDNNNLTEQDLLTKDQIQALTLDQIPLLTRDQIRALTTDQIQTLTEVQIQTLTEEQKKTLTEVQIQALTKKQIVAFQPNSQIQNAKSELAQSKQQELKLSSSTKKDLKA